MKLFFAKHTLLRRLLVTFGILLIFVAGRNIPLPKVAVQSYVNLNPFLDTAVSLTGGSLSQIGLFSLGLGPMMYAMLLAQLFNLGKRQRVLSPKVVEFRKNMLMLLIALIQAMSMAVSFTYTGTEEFLLQVLEATVVLATGAFVIAWLASVNTEKGIGGPIVLVLGSILLNQGQVIKVIGELWQGENYLVLGLFAAWSLLTILLIVIFERAEYRIPIQRISIHNKYASDSYLPIKVNLVGGMPLMYANSVLVFPQYVIMLLGYFFPKLTFLGQLSSYFDPKTFYGVLFYLLILMVLTLMLAFVNIDVVTLVENMRNSGDYIPFVRPGRASQLYLTRYVRFFAWFNAWYLVILAGVPMLLTLGDPKTQALAGLVGIFMMTAGMFLSVIEDIRVMRLRKQYVSLFD